MRAFLVDTFKFLTALVCSYMALFWAACQFLPAEFNRNTQMVSSHADSRPRIILVGNSNLKFNFDFDRIQSAFPSHRLVGCKLVLPFGSLALKDKLNKIAPQTGDIVIVSLSYALLEKEYFMPDAEALSKRLSRQMVVDAAMIHPDLAFECFSNLTLPQWSKILRAPNGTQPDSVHLIDEWSNQFYYPEKYQACWTSPENKFFIQSSYEDPDYHRWIKEWFESGIPSKVVYRFPAIREGHFEISDELIQFEETHYEYLNRFESSVYPDSLLFNQWYHLNACGRALQSSRFIAELDSLLSETSN
ncbi:hypothetical protein [Pontibacter sp. G13]|uniref:hypothetical protein n=1 Tax=Pontibacter sp. G13 TaxID=3074898 RepID=UPI00288ABF5F|nr:hypothetical protein [Pontibacter sp. G13]WNJ19716.1 hypothetical protein RJD25_04470 [Pontibacter sp. G13]